MPVGNDVVDLKDKPSQPGALHPRWDLRAFEGREVKLLESEEFSHRLRWMLWAAKESAFKAASGLDASVRFIPKAFSVELLDQVSAKVRHASGLFHVAFHNSEDWVHAVATLGEHPDLRVELEETCGSMARGGEAGNEHHRTSREVRALACRAIGSGLGIDSSLIRISGGGAPPVASALGKRLPIDLSLSHHGRFIACAWSTVLFPAVR